MPQEYGSQYTCERLQKTASALLSAVKDCTSLESARRTMREKVLEICDRMYKQREQTLADECIRIRDCARMIDGVLAERADELVGFSVAQALWDIARERSRSDLKPAFFAEMTNWMDGLQGQNTYDYIAQDRSEGRHSDRETGRIRSAVLDQIWQYADAQMKRYATGLSSTASAYREARRDRILSEYNVGPSEWNDWRWQTGHLIRRAEELARFVPLAQEERETLDRACKNRLPFAITPYYVSLMDGEHTDRDCAIRAQVIPSDAYVNYMSKH